MAPKIMVKKVGEAVLERYYLGTLTTAARCGSSPMTAVANATMAVFDLLASKDPYGDGGPQLLQQVSYHWSDYVNRSRDDLDGAGSLSESASETKSVVRRRWLRLLLVDPYVATPGIMFAYVALASQADKYVRVCLKTTGDLSEFLSLSHAMTHSQMLADIETVNAEAGSPVAGQLMIRSAIYARDLAAG